MRDDFVIFILTHGRANKVLTYDTLKSCGNTNKIYFVLDNEDDQIDLYKAKFGEENILVFDKYQKSLEFDTMDILDRDRRAIVYARNACFDFAKQLHIKYFLELDDDYTHFRSRIWDGEKLATVYLRDMDAVVDETINFLEESNALTVAWAQTGDFLGGIDSKVYKERCIRKAMNSFFCSVERPFDFIGRINEDVNTYVSLGARGQLLFTIADMTLNQLGTQNNSGGMSDLYELTGTYVKSFFTVIANPSCVKIAEMGESHKRIHHLINWECAVPKIISSEFKKED